MDINMIAIGAILIAVVTIPFLYMANGAKKQKQLLSNSLQQLANANSCVLTKHNIYNSMAIGIDENKGLVFFYKKLNDKEESKIIDLSQTHKCIVVKKTKRINKSEIIDSISLLFHQNDGNDLQFEFYNDDESLQLNGELAAAESWKKEVDNNLKVERLAALAS